MFWEQQDFELATVSLEKGIPFEYVSDDLIRAEGFIRRFAPFAWVENYLTGRSRDLRIPRRLRRNKGDETRQRYLMRTTYLDACVEVC